MMRFYKAVQKQIAVLLILLLCITIPSASALTLGDLGGQLEQQVRANNNMPSPAYLLGAEGVSVGNDLDLDGVLFDAYAYPIAEDPDAFMKIYTLWLNASGYTVSNTVSIDGYTAYPLYDTSGLYAYILPQFSGVALLLIPEGITVSPLVLPDPADYCSGGMTRSDTELYYSNDIWFESETDSFDYEAYCDLLVKYYGFTLLDVNEPKYHTYCYLVLKGGQSATMNYKSNDDCHLIVVDDTDAYGDIFIGLPYNAIGIVIEGYESCNNYNYYTFTKGATGQSETTSAKRGDSNGTSPNSAEEKSTCSNCHGQKKVDCNKCRSSGKTECTACDGDGGKYVYVSSPNYSGSSKTTSRKWEDCSKCHGTGKQDCKQCNGYGHVTCSACNGTGYK